MGFSRSFWFAQDTDEHLRGREPLLDSKSRISDRGPPPVLSPFDSMPKHYVYADNLSIIGLDPASVQQALDGGIDALESAGLETHERAFGGSAMDMLGVEVNPEFQCTRLTDTRYWRLERGIDAALRRRRLRGRAVEAILGHCTFAGLLARQSLSIFHASYKFLRLNYEEAAVVWQSLRKELQTFWDILPMIESDWVLPWNTYVTVTDASNTCVGECTRSGHVENSCDTDGFRSAVVSDSAPSLPGLTHWLRRTSLSRMQAGV